MYAHEASRIWVGESCHVSCHVNLEPCVAEAMCGRGHVSGDCCASEVHVRSWRINSLRGAHESMSRVTCHVTWQQWIFTQRLCVGRRLWVRPRINCLRGSAWVTGFHIYQNVYAHVYSCTYTIYINIYVYIYTYTFIHIVIYIYMYMYLSLYFSLSLFPSLSCARSLSLALCALLSPPLPPSLFLSLPPSLPASLSLSQWTDTTCIHDSHFTHTHLVSISVSLSCSFSSIFSLSHLRVLPSSLSFFLSLFLSHFLPLLLFLYFSLSLSLFLTFHLSLSLSLARSLSHTLSLSRVLSLAHSHSLSHALSLSLSLSLSRSRSLSLSVSQWAGGWNVTAPFYWRFPAANRLNYPNQTTLVPSPAKWYTHTALTSAYACEYVTWLIHMCE